MPTNTAQYKVPPHSNDAEQAVLGAVLLDQRTINVAAEMLRPEHFYRDTHAKIFQAMLDLSAQNAPIDALTLQDRLAKMGALEQIGGVEYLVDLAARCPSATNAKSYAEMIRETSIVRRMIQAGQTITGEGFDEPGDVSEYIDRSEKLVFDVANERTEQPYLPIKRLVNEAILRIEELEHTTGGISGVPTGFYALDKMTSGLQPGELIILAARPAMGKTSLALNMAISAAVDHGKSVGIFSFEMTRIEMTIRLMCSIAKIDSQKFRNGALSDSEWIKLTSAAEKLSRARIYIDDTAGQSEMAIRSKARRMQAQHGLDLIVIDYLQLMTASRTSRESKREQEISQISRSLKALAKELHLPVLALSQLNRDLEKRADKRPQMSDLRESGAIEQDADVILFIYRDIVYDKEAVDKKNDAEVIISKQRSGPTGTVYLRYVPEFTLFQNTVGDEAEHPVKAAAPASVRQPYADDGLNDLPDDDDMGY